MAGAFLSTIALTYSLADFAITNRDVKAAADQRAVTQGFVLGLLAIMCFVYTFARGNILWKIVAIILALPALLAVLNPVLGAVMYFFKR
jgi:hypothetical protein